MAKKKRYSVEDRANYHRKRKSSSAVRDNKYLYSALWLDGYEDKHASDNLRAVNAVIKHKRRYFNGSDYACYYGYRNGLKAQLSKRRK